MRASAASGDSGWKIRRADRVNLLESNALNALDWLVHGFSTRPGGASQLVTSKDGRRVSEKVFNLGFTDWDTRERVLQNRGKLLAALNASDMQLAVLRQVHSDIIHVLEDAAAETPTGDALITRAHGLLLAVQTADCIPILLADPHGRAVAAIHAGWRGTLRRISEKTVGRMRMLFGTRPEGIVAALGPGIGRCCYKVGPEVVKAYESQFSQARDWFEGPSEELSGGETAAPLRWLSRKPPGHPTPQLRTRLDLRVANRSILLEAGLAPEMIFASDLCTACHADLFFSYRREHRTGRMMAVIGLRP